MTQNNQEEKVLIVQAWIDRTDETQWMATVVQDSDLFALGDDFASARENLAELIAVGLKSGALSPDGHTAETIDGIRVIASTRKTFKMEAFV